LKTTKQQLENMKYFYPVLSKTCNAFYQKGKRTTLRSVVSTPTIEYSNLAPEVLVDVGNALDLAHHISRQDLASARFTPIRSESL